MDISVSAMLVSILIIVAGSLLLYFGAEGLVRGSSSMAFRFKITPLIVGLTVVAFGTSSPELVVSISASLKGNGEIALGNVIGSNICNVALILGISALIRPIKVNIKLINSDISLMLVATALFIILMLDGEINRLDGFILFAGIIAYNIWTVLEAKKEKNKEAEQRFAEELPKMTKNPILDYVLIAGGFGVLVLGADLFLKGAIDVAKYLGATDAFIGLTIVAFGTSLPELATSVVAAIKNEGDISIGNAIGSNLFNLLGIIGIAGIIVPINAANIQAVDLGVMIFVALLLLPLAWSKMKLERWEGGLLLAIYIAYISYLYSQLPG